jgi:hypothetical protein
MAWQVVDGEVTSESNPMQVKIQSSPITGSMSEVDVSDIKPPFLSWPRK